MAGEAGTEVGPGMAGEARRRLVALPTPVALRSRRLLR
jgi:hypothetical protein